MRRAFRWLGRLLAALALLAAIGAAAMGVALWRTLPPTSQTAHIPGLGAPVAIGFDKDGIPRIQAANALDAAAALGFVHARDRLFQMELMRRAASGRLSEIVGSATVPFDKMMRVLGLRHQAEAELDGLDPATRAMLDAYSRGVNAWMALRRRFAAP